MQVTYHRFYTRLFCSGSMAQVTVVSKSESCRPGGKRFRCKNSRHNMLLVSFTSCVFSVPDNLQSTPIFSKPH